MKINVVSVIFIIFSLCLFNNAYGKVTSNKDSSKNVIKKSSEPLIDVQELISDMVKKEEEIVQLTKNKKKLGRLNLALATALSVVSALLIGGTGLVMYNSNKGRRPFQLGKSKDASPEADDPSVAGPSVAGPSLAGLAAALPQNIDYEAAGKNIQEALKKTAPNLDMSALTGALTGVATGAPASPKQ
ncbi:circumsporozoite-related antigen [Plasmodium chabaudi chabaudi]|uniref:Exported protein 1, putative n=1 Tax=Plasmodium chabaudi chabaudi TaxID=31271 RepID=A0A4V0K8G2_PLACU|nr:circumsporozoite-related antigen [Plasmodium chabaudi chabaudi]VTZ68784.1 circumsporozoite-related antigen [Plasmodium chabaudi chabaudi]|eukprot:XP_016655368.1 circumsporozoite-related antigen [Plasmodium chabaudi chabaudi]